MRFSSRLEPKPRRLSLAWATLASVLMVVRAEFLAVRPARPVASAPAPAPAPSNPNSPRSMKGRPPPGAGAGALCRQPAGSPQHPG